MKHYTLNLGGSARTVKSRELHLREHEVRIVKPWWEDSYVHFQQKESNVFHGQRGETRRSSYTYLLYITEAGGWETVTVTCNIKDTILS